MNRVLVCLATCAALALPGAALAAGPARVPGRTAVRARSRAAPQPPAPASARTLEDIHIEGEIAVPQVLFITARDQRRFMEFQDRRYLRSSAQLGAASVLPGWMVVSHTPLPVGKEIAQ